MAKKREDLWSLEQDIEEVTASSTIEDQDEFDIYSPEQEEDRDSKPLKIKKGPKGKRKKIIACKEFEDQIVPLYHELNQIKLILNKYLIDALNNDDYKVIDNTEKRSLLTDYFSTVFLVQSKLTVDHGKGVPKSRATVWDFIIEPLIHDEKCKITYNKLTVLDQVAKSGKIFFDNNPKIKEFIDKLPKKDRPFYSFTSLEKNKDVIQLLSRFEKLLEKNKSLKEEYSWSCWLELEERCKNIAKNIIYTKSLHHEEAENLIQDTILYYHHLHTTYDPFFVKFRTMPYVFYILHMTRQKLRYHVQAYHIKKNKEDLKEEISDFDMSSAYVNAALAENSDGYDLKKILQEVESQLPTDKHRLVYEMLKDGYKQKNISKEIDFTQSWVSIIKKKLRATILKIVKESGQENILEEYGIDPDNYTNEDLDNIWD